eukprot:CAMPEP_0175614688 /NCGR_PEP_ID=MMETSP0096-20121207/64983_1 /TAXON_ID=311494 /ORGANISM="Alexandrium monilatum, Strain CCMP3105" /LENGTH=97 /DNA_ID=CAMNT_0016919803 /DNA_START=684 /DNA_END=977 /DNA_ORIENTATION=+
MCGCCSSWQMLSSSSSALMVFSSSSTVVRFTAKIRPLSGSKARHTLPYEPLPSCFPEIQLEPMRSDWFFDDALEISDLMLSTLLMESKSPSGTVVSV